jgi:phage/plasmid-associated DNA primase
LTWKPLRRSTRRRSTSTPQEAWIAGSRIAAAECTLIFTEGQGKINFENGTLDLETMTMLPFKREDYLTYCLPYCYAPGTHPLINAFLKETIPDVHTRQAYMAHIGLALMQDSSLHFVLLLLGPTRAGKSTLLAIANAACGTSPLDNYAEDFSFAGPSLFSREFEGKRSRSRWVHRRMVCADEIPAEALRDEEFFKTMSAHGGVEMRGMHKDEDTANRWRPKMILAANDRPRCKDVAGAVKERCIFVSCPNHRLRGERLERRMTVVPTAWSEYSSSTLAKPVMVLPVTR